MKQVEFLLADLNADLKKIEDNADGEVQKAEQGIMACQKYVEKLREFITGRDFADEKEEIHFFKYQKPAFTSRLLYYIYLLKLESGIGINDRLAKLRYYKRQMRNVAAFSRRNKEFIYYYRTGSTALDELYFKRGNADIKLLSNPLIFQFDPQFSTLHDHLVAKLVAKERIAKHIGERLHELEGIDSPAGGKPKGPQLKWTAPKVGLVEVVLSFIEADVFNSGTLKPGKIIEFFAPIGDMDSTEFHRKVVDIAKRKKNVTVMLDELGEAVRNRVERGEE